MAKSCPKQGFILEDNPLQSQYFKDCLKAAGCEEVSTADTVEMAIQVFHIRGAIFLLDMKTPLITNGKTDYNSGLKVRAHLLQSGVDSNKILLMTMGISDQDIQSANSHQVSRQAIIQKDQITKEILELILSRN